jgi:mannosyl-3-phosphoglycerate phosphatase
LSIKIIIFADLDGTILNDKYCLIEIQPLITKLLQLNASIVINSSKTKQEIIYYKKKLKINEPFIAENGSAIYIPKNYFSIPYIFNKQTTHYNIIELGLDYSTIRKKLGIIKKKTKAKIIGFGDMDPSQLAKNTNLSSQLARNAKKREYDEPFQIIEGDPTIIIEAIKNQDLNCTKGGNYYHLIGKTDKGKATNILKELYLKEFQKIVTIAIGDSPNDQPMLEQVNKPFFIKDKAQLPLWKEILSIVKEYTLPN